MLSFYDDLNNKSIEAACSTVNLTAGDTPAPTSTSCKFTTGSASGVLSPANVMQPTVAELQKLGMLDKSFQDSFLWPTLSTVNRPYASNCNPQTAACTTTANAAPAAYATRIQKWCDGVLVTPANNLSCATPQLKSLTFNAQPFADADIGSFFKMARYQKLNTAISSMGGDGFMSLELIQMFMPSLEAPRSGGMAECTTRESSAPLPSDRKAQSQSARNDHLGRSSCVAA